MNELQLYNNNCVWAAAAASVTDPFSSSHYSNDPISYSDQSESSESEKKATKSSKSSRE